ncbi:hypothetical protein FISHEDRAFT_69412 [Fistulina hepatica ATCC 64428]|uniref:Oxo-4-hydroxy-4-carboxy-5-ureidoimidazoline decarboxylase domain-containing protein n=1 Tax=Fistulina hepatica ATCC 64428 TaxID=1128425 RepID=A0A0D7AQ78_9AGAR|nr:hypothetical protein FISHEDRAFT_69412 [Fistulina hepatica ATCC 64428]
MAFPDISSIQSDKDSTGRVLSTLFEWSPVLEEMLVPALSANGHTFTSYSDLINAALGVISSWDASVRASFIAGHPRIGEVSGLSKLSAQEQAARATTPQVLHRLAYLNDCYERRYVGLRYITFVNGRSRAAITQEMEGVLGLSPSDVPPPDHFTPVDGTAWMSELERAIVDIGLIAKSRLKALGAE